MAFAFAQTTEDEFREFGRKHFPGAPQPTVLPPFVTPSANSQSQDNASPSSAILDIAYNAGFTTGAGFGHAVGRVSGYTEGYNAALAQLGGQTANATVPAEPNRSDAEVEAEDQVYDAQGYEEEDLGFYSDGAKRTIDDEDVQFYRRSELMQMLKDAKNRVAERKEREADEQVENEAEFEAELEAELEAQLKDDAQEKSDTHDPGDAECNAPEQTELDKAESQVGHNAKEVNQPISPLVSSTGSSLTHESSFVKPDVVGSIDEDQADSGANTPSSTAMVSDESCKRPTPLNSKKKMTATSEANRGKKRKRPARNPPPDIEGITYRRIARELDEMPSESVELDY